MALIYFKLNETWASYGRLFVLVCVMVDKRISYSHSKIRMVVTRCAENGITVTGILW